MTPFASACRCAWCSNTTPTRKATSTSLSSNRTASDVVDHNEIIERRACVTGIGQSDIGRRLGRDPLELTLDACLAAIDDAGLTVADIDGLSTYPGSMNQPPGFSGAGAYEVIDALRLNCGWYNSGLETSGQLGSVVNACLAVASGL